MESGHRLHMAMSSGVVLKTYFLRWWMQPVFAPLCELVPDTANIYLTVGFVMLHFPVLYLPTVP